MLLIACEESQIVTSAFRDLGYEAYSADIQPTSGQHPEWHIQGNVIPLLKLDWDMIIAFPPCTHLSAAGAHLWKQKQADGRQQKAIDFFMAFFNSNCKRIAVENPVGIINTVYRKPDQIFHPYHFGDPFRKRTCLWLRGLPLLKWTDPVKPEEMTWQGNRWRNKWLSNKTKKDRSKSRSKTFPGIARAMAFQWGKELENVKR